MSWSEQEIIGEKLGRYVALGPPSEQDYSQIPITPYALSSYEIADDYILINDAVWGSCRIGEEPGDEVFLDLVGETAIQRLQGIEQLTLPRFMTTIPGTSEFSRWEHVWGALVLTRQLGKEAGIDARQLRIYELRAFLSDVQQGAFSHLRDWMLQGMGGSEDQHDDDQPEFFRRIGLDVVLNRHGYELEEVLVKGQKYDWTERPSPDLCTDRLDFGVRESFRWLANEPNIMQMSRRPFHVEEDQIVMDSREIAKLFSKTYMLLATEHWQEPVHRLQLLLLQEMVRYALVHGDAAMMNDRMGLYHPADVLMSVDEDFTASMVMAYSHQWLLHDLASHIGRERRMVARMVRSQELMSFLGREVSDTLPNPVVAGNWQGKTHPLSPSNVEIIPVDTTSDVDDYGQLPNALDFELPPLKPRWIDPLFKDEAGKTRRLSEADDTVAGLIEQLQGYLKQRYVGRVFLNPQHRELLETAITKNQEAWEEMLDRPRMPDEVFRSSFEHAAGYGIAKRLTLIDWLR